MNMKLFLALLVFPLLACGFVRTGSAREWVQSTDLGSFDIGGVAVADSNNIWAVAGRTGNEGLICHYTGAEWEFQTSLYSFSAQTGQIHGCFAYDSSHVWAVGNAVTPFYGRVYFYDGAQWYLQTKVGESGFLYDVYAADPSHVWSSGNGGNIYSSSDGGATWMRQTFPMAMWFGIHGTDADNVWAVGGWMQATDIYNRIIYYNGSDWTVQTWLATMPNGDYLRDVWAVETDDVWVAGDSGLILHYDGSAWTVSTDIAGDNIVAACVAALGPHQVWAGFDGEVQGIYFYDGAGWLKQGDLSLEALDARLPEQVWAGGSAGEIYHFINTPSPTPSPSTTPTAPPSPEPTLTPVKTPPPTPTPSCGCGTPTRTPPTPTPPSAVSSLIDSGDYNGDGTSDIAVFRGSSGMWSVRNLTRVYFGNSTDSLVPADYDGDGTADIAIFRGSSGMWSVRNLTRFYLGGTDDQPVPGDYSGDGIAEAGIFRGSTGLWSIRDLTRVYLGSSGDTIIPGYYAPGGAKDVAICRPSAGLWSVRNLTRFYFGQSNDFLVPGDYSGTGQWAAGVFRRPDSMWAIRDVTRFYVGTILDLGVPADYDGDGADEAGLFRGISGLWAIRDLTRAYFGSAGDLPATR
jgi:hypothetical protein